MEGAETEPDSLAFVRGRRMGVQISDSPDFVLVVVCPGCDEETADYVGDPKGLRYVVSDRGAGLDSLWDFFGFVFWEEDGARNGCEE